MFQRWVFRSHGAKDACHTTLCAVELSVECCFLKIIVILSVALLGWVSPGTTTDGVSPIFSCKKRPFLDFLVIIVSQFYGVTPIYFRKKTDDLFSSSLLFRSLVCHPHLFYLSDLICPLLSPPGGCHPGRSALTTLHRPPHPPSCDATEYCNTLYTEIARESTCSCGIVSLLN